MNGKKAKVTKYPLLILAFLFTLSPFIYLAQYNHPSADDYCYASKSSYLGFAATQVDHWLTWSGRYTATALLSIFTIDINNLLGYRIFPILLFLLFGVSIFVFIRSLFTKAAVYDICALSFVIFFLYIFKAPNITEAFYWLAGSVTYQVASILSLFLFSIILHLLRQRKRSKKINLTIISSVLGIIIVGLNEVSLIYICVVLFLWLVLSIYRTRKLEWSFAIIVIITSVAAAISLTAPGNYERMSTVMVEQFNFPFSVSGSFQLAFWAVLSWLPLLLLLVIIFWGSFKRIAIQEYENFDFSPPWKFIAFSIIFLFGLLALGYFPTYWSQGGRPPTRTINVILLVFIMGSFWIVLLSLIKLWKDKKSLPTIPPVTKGIAAIVIISYIIFPTNNIKSAYKDIFSEIAVQYDKQLQKRYSHLSNCEMGLCDIPPLKHFPQTIFAYELGLNPSDQIYYYNICLQDYIHNSYTSPKRDSKE